MLRNRTTILEHECIRSYNDIANLFCNFVSNETELINDTSLKIINIISGENLYNEITAKLNIIKAKLKMAPET